MLTHPTTDRLRELGLVGMARALEEQRRHTDAADLGFEDRLAMLVEREALERDSKRLATRLRFAGLRQQATRRMSTIAPPAAWIARCSNA